MKKQIKSLIKIGILCFGISLMLWTCQDDNHVHQHNEVNDVINSDKTYKRVSLEQLQNDQLFSKLAKEFDTEKLFSSNRSKTNAKNKSSEETVIITDTIAIVEKENYKSYTFLVKTPGQLPNQVNNLILEENQGISNAFSLTYTFDETWLADYHSHNHSHSTPIGKVYLTPYNANNILNKSSTETCSWVTVTFTSPCGCGHHYLWQCNGCSSSPAWPSSFTTSQYVCENNGNNGTEILATENTDDGFGGGGFGSGGGSSGSESNMVMDDTSELEDYSIILNCIQTSSGLGELSSSQRSEIANFIRQNGCSQSDAEFVKEAIETLNNEGEVDFEDKVILDSTVINNQKVKCVYDKLKNLSNTVFNNIINDHFESIKKSNIRFKIITPQFGQDAFTRGFTNNGTSFFEIQLNPSVVANASTIEIALMLIHESIHAELLDRCIQLGIINAFDSNGNPNFTNTALTYDTYDALFALLVYQYKNYNGGNSQWNHDLFTVLNYRTEMAQNLVNIHPWLNDSNNDFLSNINNDPLNLYGNFTINELMDYITWIGLEGTQEYNNQIQNNPLEATKKNYVENSARQHYTNNCN